MIIQEILEEHRIDDDDQCPCGCDVKDEVTRNLTTHELRIAHLAEVLEEHMREREAQMRQLIRDMTDPGECWFDHRGGCQEHGYLELKPGELCPHAEAKQLLGGESSDGR